MKRVDADNRSLKQLLELEVERHETSHGRHGSHRRSSERACNPARSLVMCETEHLDVGFECSRSRFVPTA